MHRGIERYYTERVCKYGATPRGVDWSSRITQEVRFAQLLKLCDFSASFSINDIGCGYGALLSYLDNSHHATEIDYLGIDLSPAMIREAKRLWSNRPCAAFHIGSKSPRIADYSVASGVFNVKLDQPLALWEDFIAQTLVDMHTTSRRGLSANFMAPEISRTTRAGLYRCIPTTWIRFFEQDLKSSVQLVATYGLNEFTLVVRR